jgi:hypothetical protein
MSWRNFSFVLAALCLFQAWRACDRPPSAPAKTAECAPATSTSSSRTTTAWRSTDTHDSANNNSDRGEPEEPAAFGPSINGFKLPAWTLWLAPHPGESMLDYRDRMMPLAQAALAPHRNRVARGRDDFAKQVGLDPTQRAQLDGAVHEAATAIQDKVMGSLLAGDLSPSTFKPMTGVALARDLLDTIDVANRKFLASLREDQRARLRQHPFDFADYLLFSARWEDALGVTN